MEFNKLDIIYINLFLKGFNDSDLSLLYCCIYEDMFIYDPDSKIWYYINQYGIYQEDYSNIYFYKKYNQLYEQIEKKYLLFLEQEKEETKKALIIKNFKFGYNYIKKNKTKESILKECLVHYAKKDIGNKFNNINNYAIGFNNGVYDLTTDQFRNGKPSEYINMTTGYDYKKPTEDNINNLYSLLRDIMPNEEELTYLLKTLSLSLINDNPLEEFYIWIGTGGNGKGVLSTLLKAMLGKYCGSIDIKYLTKSKSEISHHANAADPQMADLRYARLVISTEPEADGEIKLRSDKLKQISGRDVIKTRKLRENCFEFIPKFKLAIQTNFYPEIDGTDGGVKRRLRSITYRVSFVDNPKNNNERKKNPEIKNLINTDEYKNALFEILKNHYHLYIKEGIKVPKIIQDETQDYLDDNDIVQAFVNNKIEKTNNVSDRIPQPKMNEEFKKYNREGNSNKFKRSMENKGFTVKKIGGNYYYCYCKFKTIKQEEEKEEEEI